MSNRSELVPTRVMDKNGRIMTVHKRATSLSGKSTVIPAIKTPESESLEDAAAGYVSRIKTRSRELDGKGFTLPIYKLTQEQLRLAAELIDNPDAGRSMPFMIDTHMKQLGTEPLTAWLTMMNRHYSDVIHSGFLVRRNGFEEQEASEYIGAIPRTEYAYYRRRGLTYSQYIDFDEDQKFSPEQELNIALITLAAWSSDLEGRRDSSNGMYGSTRSIDNSEMMDFAIQSTREQVEAACHVLKNGGATRFSEIIAIIDNEVAIPVAEGWL